MSGATTRALSDIVDEYLGTGEYAANPEETVVVADTGAAIADMAMRMQAAGHDVGAYTEAEWLAALRKLGVEEEDLVEAMEEVASWGITDDRWYFPEQGEAQR